MARESERSCLLEGWKVGDCLEGGGREFSRVMRMFEVLFWVVVTERWVYFYSIYTHVHELCAFRM